MMESRLVGYVRKSKGNYSKSNATGEQIKVSIDIEAFNECVKMTSRDCREFVQLVINMPKMEEIISGDREVTSVCQMTEE